MGDQGEAAQPANALNLSHISKLSPPVFHGKKSKQQLLQQVPLQVQTVQSLRLQSHKSRQKRTSWWNRLRTDQSFRLKMS